MFSNKKWLVLTLVLVIASLVAAACTTPEPEQVVVTVEVPGEDGETVIITATPAPTEEATEEAGGEGEAAGPSGELTTFQTGIYEDLTSTNYWAVLDTEATAWNFYVNGNYHPALYGLASQRFDFVPGIAAGMPGERTQDGDFVTIEVALRDDVTWSDGEAITADDIVFTSNVIKNFQLSSNWETYSPDVYDHVEAVDDTTVKFFFTDVPGLGDWEFGVALAPVLAEHYWGPIVDAAADEAGLADADPEDEEAYAEASALARAALYAHVPEGEPVYGPMQFGRWEPAAFAENVAREDYPDKGAVTNLYENGAYEEVGADGEAFTAYGDPEGDPYLSIETGPFVPGVIFSVYGSQDAAVLALLDGEIDYVFNPNGLSPGLFESVSGSEEIVTIENPNYGFRYVAFNTRENRNPVTSDVAFRQAVATVIDQQFITDRILQGSAIPMWTVMPESNRFWYNPDSPRWGFDAEGNNLDRAARIDAAVAILQEAGYTWEGGEAPFFDADLNDAVVGGNLVQPDGSAVPDLTMLAPSAGYDPMRATAAIWVEQWMREIGIPVTAELTGFNNISDAVFAEGPAEWDMYILGWGLGNPAYPTFFDSFFTCGGDSEAGGFNTPGYCDEEYDQLAADFLGATDLETAKDLAFQMQQKLGEDLPYVTLFTTPLLEAYRANVTFPFTDGLGGIEFYYGMQGTVKAYAAE